MNQLFLPKNFWLLGVMLCLFLSRGQAQTPALGEGFVDVVTFNQKGLEFDLTANGWAGAEAPGRKIIQLILKLDDHVVFQGLPTEAARPDVVQVKGRRDWAMSGWTIIAAIPKTMQNQTFHLTAQAVLDNGATFDLTVGHKFQVVITRESFYLANAEYFLCVAFLLTTGFVWLYYRGKAAAPEAAPRRWLSLEPQILLRNLWTWLPLAGFVFVALWAATNVPIQDEYGNALEFQAHISDLGSDWRAVAGYLFLGIDNGHQLIFMHLAVYLEAELLGHVDFCLLSLIGCGFAIGNFFLLTRLCGVARNTHAYSAAAWCYFSLAWWENIEMGTQAFNINLDILAVIMACQGLKNQRVLGPVLWGLVAAWTCANGVLILPICILCFVLNGAWTKRHLVAGLLVLALLGFYVSQAFFSGSTNPAGFLGTPSAVAQHFFAMFGSPIMLGAGMTKSLKFAIVQYLSPIIGMYVLALIVGSVLYLLQLRRPPATWLTAVRALPAQGWPLLLLWLVLTDVMISCARAGLGVGSSFAPRYMIFFSLLAVSVIPLAEAVLKQKGIVNRDLYFQWLLVPLAFFSLNTISASLPGFIDRAKQSDKTIATWGQADQWHNYPVQFVASDYIFTAWQHHLLGTPYSLFRQTKPPASSSWTYPAMDSEGVQTPLSDGKTMRQTLIIPAGLAVKSVALPIGTFGGCPEGEFVIRVSARGKSYDEKIPASTVADRSFVRFQLPAVLAFAQTGDLEITFQSAVPAPHAATVLCSPPPPILYKTMSLANQPDQSKVGMCLQIEFVRLGSPPPS